MTEEKKRPGRPPKAEKIEVVAIRKFSLDGVIHVEPGESVEIDLDSARKLQNVGAVKVVI